jgi:hypothetical protein
MRGVEFSQLKVVVLARVAAKRGGGGGGGGGGEGRHAYISHDSKLQTNTPNGRGGNLKG